MGLKKLFVFREINCERRSCLEKVIFGRVYLFTVQILIAETKNYVVSFLREQVPPLQ